MGRLHQICSSRRFVEEKSGSDLCPMSCFTFLPRISISTMSKCDKLDPIFHFHWPSVYSESVTQPRASIELQ